MTQITKPTDLSKIWADSGDKATPLDSKISTGWQVEIPPRQWFNWLDNRQDRAIAHINQHGIAVWDANTMYYAGRSYVQDPATGNIFRCNTTNRGNAPAVGSSFWTMPFADAATAFSEAQADGKYAQLSQNGNDFPNKAAVRNNLSVYSRTEVDNLSPRGFIAFNGATGVVISSRNLSVTKIAAGHYAVMINPAAQKGNNAYTAIVSSISNGVTSQGFSQSNGAHNERNVWIGNRYTNYFDVFTVFRESRMTPNNRGNDANDSHALAINLSDYAYVSVALFW